MLSKRRIKSTNKLIILINCIGAITFVQFLADNQDLTVQEVAPIQMLGEILNTPFLIIHEGK